MSENTGSIGKMYEVCPEISIGVEVSIVKGRQKVDCYYLGVAKIEHELDARKIMRELGYEGNEIVFCRKRLEDKTRHNNLRDLMSAGTEMPNKKDIDCILRKTFI